MKAYNKLVRDKHIPRIIEAKGKKANIRVLSDVEYRTLLEVKLHEEFLELTHANEQEQLEELADIIEVGIWDFGE
ncbi:nucleoside triphosphate pyrophosphohydrolase [Paenibacillus sp. LjRoot153]|uniref:nucleoside triphosphate pyrophosphohydrolase n=1 Tax=Paenibacillus sp. LjRoot153 TaxID=3342270 RepID=UPI003ED0054C